MSDDTEMHGFNVRTQVDDLIGKLVFIRDRDYRNLPSGLLAALDDADEIIERAIEAVVDLPADKRWQADSGSDSYGEACSCGMPTWAACERGDP